MDDEADEEAARIDQDVALAAGDVCSRPNGQA
jgi:hypothetical protein